MPSGSCDCRKLHLAAFCAALLLGALTSTGCRKPPAAPPRLPPLVTVTQAIAQDVPLYIDEIGTCTARDSVSIKPQASGQITDVHFTDGATVKKGDLLFVIEPRPYQAALDQAKAALTQSEAALDLAKILLAHAEVLYPVKATSKEDLQTKQNSVETNKALIQANQAAIKAAEINLDYCYIHAPMGGRLGSRQVDAGNLVVANSGQVMLVIQELDPMYANFTVTEAELATIRAAMAGRAPKVQVRLPDEPEASAREGNLDFLDNTVQANTGTLALRTTIANADHRFWPNQFVKVRLVLRTLKDAVLVPAQATQISQNGDFVYVLKPDSTAEFRPIKLGQRHGQMVVILDGLHAGETVIVTGQLLVMPGGKVTVQAPPASRPASSTAASAPTSSRAETHEVAP